MTKPAEDVAPTLTTADLGKLPDRWYPTYSARKAGALKLGDFWGRLWFEAITELLYQRKAEGLPGLFELMDRQDKSYHEYAVFRLLRLAADGIDTEHILARVRTRLTTLVHVSPRECARQAAYWMDDDPRPMELLKPMADIAVPQSYGDSVGIYIQQSIEEVEINKKRRKK